MREMSINSGYYYDELLAVQEAIWKEGILEFFCSSPEWFNLFCTAYSFSCNVDNRQLRQMYSPVVRSNKVVNVFFYLCYLAIEFYFD